MRPADESRVYREQLADVDDHERQTVESGFLLEQFVVVRQTAHSAAGVPASSRARPARRRRRRAVDRRRRAGPAVDAVDVEQRRRETDRQVAGRHLRRVQPSATYSTWKSLAQYSNIR